jgi:uncharacterized protein (TIRG00374 family)
MSLRNLLQIFPWRRILFFLLALALLVWVGRTISIRAALATLAQLSVRDLLLLAVVNLLIVATFSMRWWLLLQAQGQHIPFWRLLGYRLTAFGISYFTPGSHFGGEPYQVYATSHWHGAPASVSIAAVTLDKILEMLVNFALLMVGVLVLLATRSGLAPWVEQQLAFYSVVLLAIPLGLLVALWLGHHPLSGVIVLMGRLTRLPLAQKAWAQALQQSETQTIWLCRHHPQTVLLALLVTLISWVGVLGEFWLLTWLLELSLSPLQAMTSLVAARIAILLPVPAGLGALEASQVLAMESLNLDPSIGIAIAVVIRARDVALGLGGLALGGIHVWQKAKLAFASWLPSTPPPNSPSPSDSAAPGDD